MFDASRSNGPDYHLSFRCCGQGLGPCTYTSEFVIFEEGLTIRGHIRFNGICMKLHALAVTDHPDDQMELMPSGGGMTCGGLCNRPETVTGRGRFLINQGTLQIGSPHLPRCGKPMFEVAGTGQILISEQTACELKVTFTPSAGTVAATELSSCSRTCGDR